ncbi:hypothetical protein [Iamia sp.]|uniref:hypothetical protein n=1 Tax=Iamia sp. TaxID=2722710 RepID=UPI002D7F56A8|nr:hypothetical protein [Iamia sp.]
MHADREVLRAAIDAGAAGYLVKDCSIDEIAEVIRTATDDESPLSPALAASMLHEVRHLDEPDEPDRVVTKREEKILQLIADGCSTGEVTESSASARRRSRTTWRRSTRSSTPATAPRPCSKRCGWASSASAERRAE